MPFMRKDFNICCLSYLRKMAVSTLYLILKGKIFIPGFQVIDFEFLQAKVIVFFLNRDLINFAWKYTSFFLLNVYPYVNCVFYPNLFDKLRENALVLCSLDTQMEKRCICISSENIFQPTTTNIFQPSLAKYTLG